MKLITDHERKKAERLIILSVLITVLLPAIISSVYVLKSMLMNRSKQVNALVIPMEKPPIDSSPKSVNSAVSSSAQTDNMIFFATGATTLISVTTASTAQIVYIPQHAIVNTAHGAFERGNIQWTTSEEETVHED